VTAAQPPDFDAMYAADADPFRVESSWYERRKLAVVVASLPRERYGSAWEPGSGLGVASVALADRVDVLTASDSSRVALDAARRRCRGLPHVRCVESTLPDVPVDEPVDLIVVAEFLYYVPDLESALDVLFSSLAPNGHLVMLHWAHRPHDAYRSGPDVHARVAREAPGRGAVRLVEHRDEDFLLDIYERHL
jgi:trans-aconitate methyltransferase